MSFIFFGIAAHSRHVLSARKSRADYTLGTRTNKGRLKFGFHDENLFRRPFQLRVSSKRMFRSGKGFGFDFMDIGFNGGLDAVFTLHEIFDEFGGFTRKNAEHIVHD